MSSRTLPRSLRVTSAVIVLALAAVVVVGVLLAIAPVRRLLQSRLEPLLRQSLPQLLTAATEPRRLVTALGGILLQNAGYVLALDASLRAFGVSLAVPTVIGVYLVSSAVGSVAPPRDSRIAAAIEVMSEGIWLTSPSPMVSCE